MDRREFVRACPKSALSAQYVASLDNTEQKEFIALIIQEAVFCDSWELYFEFAERNNVTITEGIAMEAVQSVGLDPFSAPLWMKAAACCSSPAAKKNLFEFGLSVPLYGWMRLLEAYKMFMEGVQGECIFREEDFTRVSAVLKREGWPDRYAEIYTPGDAAELRGVWCRHINLMMQVLSSEMLGEDLQKRRIDLALQQMCCQLPSDDSCWFQNALFQFHIFNDVEAARRVVEAGIVSAGPSIALENIASVLHDRSRDGAFLLDHNVSPEARALIQQRRAAETIATEGATKDGIRLFRSVGKEAAEQGLSDWKVYSQWCCAEDAVLHDSKMATKVLANGMICCSSSPTDTLLLGSEAMQYHLLHRHERETLGYAEQLIEQQSTSHHSGKIKASWNNLVRVESLLGLSSSNGTKRRGELFPRSAVRAFLERSRVGNYIPCDRSTFEWVQFSEDFTLDKFSVGETPFKGIDPPRFKSLDTTPICAEDAQLPNEDVWDSFTPAGNKFPPQNDDDPDEVAGARELRGKLVYRIKVDARTEARCGRDELARQQTKTETPSEHGSSLGSLLQKIREIKLSDNQVKRLHTVSSEWLLRFITSSDLDLERVLKERSTRKLPMK